MPAEQSRDLDWSKLIDTALTAPGNVGNTYNRFYNYSFTNQMLLLMQGVLEPVATYKRWQSLGRQVIKGSKAKTILRPMIFEKKDQAGEVEERKVRFKAVKCIFGYSETTGEPLPPAETPGWDLDRALGKLAVRRVPYQLLDGNTQGYSVNREFAINPMAVRPLKTTFHELGHIVLGHTTADELQQYEQHRGLMEFQAEGTAHLTMNELGQLDEAAATESRGYIQTWLRDEQPPHTAIRQVFVATDQILRAGRPDTEGGEL